jgi:hypothetical protein
MTYNAMRDLETQLRNVNLRAEPGENVETFCMKVKEVAERLDQGISYKPVDLSLMVAQNFVNSSVETFRIQAIQVYTELQRDPRCASYQDILAIHIESFIWLKGSKMWPPLVAKKQEGAQAKTLQKKGSNQDNKNNSKGKPKKDLSQVTCYDCNK